MKYKIEIHGLGAEFALYELNPETKETLFESDVESGNMEQDEICQLLNIEYLFEDKETILGLCDGEYQVFVYDENDELVWESEETGLDNTEFDSDESEGEFLLVEDCQKGNFFTGHFESDTFDPELLSSVNREYIRQYSSVVKFKYDDEVIETDWSDTSSKGFNFYLS
jgi:hypothetical protein